MSPRHERVGGEDQGFGAVGPHHATEKKPILHIGRRDAHGSVASGPNFIEPVLFGFLDRFSDPIPLFFKAYVFFSAADL